MTAGFIPHILIAGLGNYPLPLTRHSIGHLIIDALAARHSISLANDRAKGGLFGTAQVSIEDTPVSLSLFKSKSLMNVSGPSIVSALRQSSKLPSSLILVSDSLSHRVESLHLRFGGSANGHNGVKSVIKALGNDDQFYRLRVGIGKNEGVDAAEYVMRRLSQHERGFWGEEHGEGVDLVMREVGKVMRERVKKGPGLAELGI
ncbi:peptidyl-tRNA hydrolase [Pterulicium gracile]|uniref:peptidyl-tRNA hydrolase n=1 Tax=Pterulicium gracile TaxID=1884261 RepID=A0A5C3QWG2_9AGAR|nr:peptidyl-tRNA hydrolase [Pterula gracilis]